MESTKSQFQVRILLVTTFSYTIKVSDFGGNQTASEHTLTSTPRNYSWIYSKILKIIQMVGLLMVQQILGNGALRQVVQGQHSPVKRFMQQT